MKHRLRIFISLLAVAFGKPLFAEDAYYNIAILDLKLSDDKARPGSIRTPCAPISNLNIRVTVGAAGEAYILPFGNPNLGDDIAGSTRIM